MGDANLILLDTNYLINALIQDSDECAQFKQWYLDGQPLVTSAIVWYEFLCGPVNELQIEVIEAFLQGQKQTPNVIPFDADISSRSAFIFNQLGRARRMRVDVMIGATAIQFGAQLATANIRDFEAMIPYGLKIWGQ